MSRKLSLMVLWVCILLCMQFPVFAAEPESGANCSNGSCTLDNQQNSGDHADDTSNG